MALPRHVLRGMAGSENVDRIHLVVSRGAVQVLRHELESETSGPEGLLNAASLSPAHRAKIEIHRDNELDAPISSGSYTLDGAAIVPCSAGTTGALAAGAAGTLVHRVGSVALKERWPLVIGFRETPITAIHLENLRRLAYLGATILPPLPAFYVGGEDFGRFLDHYVLRVLDRFGIHEPGAREGLRWGE